MKVNMKGSATALFLVATLVLLSLPACNTAANTDDLKTSTLLAEDTPNGEGGGEGEVVDDDGIEGGEGGGEGAEVDDDGAEGGNEGGWSSCAPGTACEDPEGNKWYTDENGVTTPYEGDDFQNDNGNEDDNFGDDDWNNGDNGDGNWKDNGGGTEIADSKEVEKQKKDMQKNIGEKMQKEWERLIKREEKTVKRLGKLIEKAEKYQEKLPEDTSTKLDEVITAIEASISSIESIKTETENGLAKLIEVQEEAKPCVENLSPGTTTWKELEDAWNCTKKVEVFWMLRDAVDGRFAIEEMGEGTWEMRMEIVKMESELGTLPEAVSTLLTTITSVAEKNDALREEGKTLYDEALAAVDNVLALTDPEEVRDAVDEIWNGISEEVRDFNDTVRDDMDTFWMDDPWMIMQEAWESGHILRFIEDMKNEITFISGEIEKAKKVLEELKTLEIEKEGVLKAIEDFDELITKVEGVLAKMQELLEDPELEPEMMEESWGILDGVGQSFDQDINKIFKYLEDHEDQFKSLSEEVQESLKTWEKEGISGGPGPNNDKIGEFYGEDMKEELIKQIKAEVMEEVMRQISSELMESLSPYLEQDAIAEILNNIGIFQEGTLLLSNSTEVYNILDGIDFDKLTQELKDLGERTRKALIVSKMKDALMEKWAEADAAAEADDIEEMDAIAAEIEKLLNENDELSVTGDEAYQFRDVPLVNQDGENPWYFGSVMTMKEDGVVSGYKDENGNFTGEFGPENNVTIAEALKMALEAAGHQMTPTDGGHWAQSAGYVAKAKELGIGDLIDLGNLDKYATREEIAVIVAEAFELDTDMEYEGVFSDYKGKFGGHIQAVYDAEIFTGEGDTKNFNGSGLINRAAMAKVINYAISANSSEYVFDKIDDFEEGFGTEVDDKDIETFDFDDDDDDVEIEDSDDDVMDFIEDLPDEI